MTIASLRERAPMMLNKLALPLSPLYPQTLGRQPKFRLAQMEVSMQVTAHLKHTICFIYAYFLEINLLSYYPPLYLVSLRSCCEFVLVERHRRTILICIEFCVP